MQETIWALAPAIVAIALALITKEVYFSLLTGIITGALFYAEFHIGNTLETTFVIMGEKVGGNINIIIFLVLLGMIVSLMSKSGASVAYGNWAAKSIKTKKGALASTAGLGALIFVDDYFNCLTVGTVMSPVTDKYKITRAKLAYIIDATAAPVCILAPISSWAAAVGSSLPEGSNIDGFSLFLKTIPFNLYAILTLIMVAFIIFFDLEFSAMKRYGEVYGEKSDKLLNEEELEKYKKGKVYDLIIPILFLIGACVYAMTYTGGIFEGVSFVDSFANSNASLSLVYGASTTIIIVALLYLPRKVITYIQFTESLVEGFKSMVPAILILTFAWTLSGVCGEDYLNVGGYVSSLVNNSEIAHALIPAVFFLISLGLAFSTGTSWGTFGILIPIATAVFGGVESPILIITVASILAGAVAGDHVSPISDTTILSSTGANCNHIDHVSTQMPYALFVIVFSFFGYLIAGFTQNGWIALAVSVVGLLIGLTTILKIQEKKEKISCK